ncbi:MAG: 2-oxoacid:acceptor oxidoreductase family protein, partial [Clostridiales bacterium]|nr:2-oxoacid:acceptor oxidoreductase family protein [Clostridiales bacterium]
MKREIASKKLKFYNIDGVKIAREVGLGGRINMCLQAAFFKIAGVIPEADAVEYMKAAVKKTYGKKGDDIVNMNWKAIDVAISQVQEINYPASWAEATTGAEPAKVAENEYFKEVIHPIATQKGDALPVSTFDPRGFVPTGTTKFEKRGIAVNVPKWIPENCIMCNQCSLVCPHACIRPFLAKEENLAGAPEAYITKDARGKDVAGYKFRMQLSPLDCTGCGNCVQVCPAKQKALEMEPLAESCKTEEANWDFAIELPRPEISVNKSTVIGSQYLQPLFEFSGACAGCGETPYVKLVSQLFGDRMIIANATGCSSIYGGSAPTCPYTVNEDGHGPAWANSLFEDNAEFGYGMALAYLQRRAALKDKVAKVLEDGIAGGALKEALEKWAAAPKDADNTKACAKVIKAELPAAIAAASGDAKAALQALDADADLFIKKSIWIIGGDGWAYDIGYGGVDHVLAMDEDINILVLDTEVYSNTGGQASKSSPTGAVAKFAAAGKRTKKKDLGSIAMTYGYIYVASCAMGANQAQLVKAMNEAEAYDGPSLV